MNNKKRTRKYSTTLRKNNKTDIRPHEIYKTDKNNGFLSLDPLSVQYEGVSFRITRELFKDLQVLHKDLKIYLNNCNNTLTAFLIKKGYNTPNVKQNALIEDLSHLLVIQDEIDYELLKYDVTGKYIIGSVKLDGLVILAQEKPIDYDLGFYEYIDGKFVVDENKKLEYYGGTL